MRGTLVTGGRFYAAFRTGADLPKASWLGEAMSKAAVDAVLG